MAIAIRSLEDPLFPAHRRHGVNSPFNIYYKCGIMLILKGWYLDRLLVPLHCSTVIPQIVLSLFSRTVLSFIRIRKFASPNSRIALLSQRVLFREGCPRELARLVIRGGRLNWGGYYRL